MSQLDPPPRIIEKFTRQWRDWLYFTWEFISDSASSLTSHIGLTNWNAHGDTAVGDATSPLKVEDATFYAEGSTPDSPIGDAPTSGSGRRFMIIPSRNYAIRSGRVTGVQWDHDGVNNNIGNQSAAFNRDTIASGANSFAAGLRCTASANPSFVYGVDSTASGTMSVAFGNTSTASGNNSFCTGRNATADADDSVVMGFGASSGAVATNGVAIGEAAATTTINGLAIGANTNANGAPSNAVGYTVTASGANSTALGTDNTASGGSALTVGRWITASNTNSIVIGQGVSDGSRLINNIANSLMLGVNTTTPTVILRNSRCGIEETNPLSTLDVGGSVGYQNKYVETSVDSPYTLSVELVLNVDNRQGNFTCTLPDCNAANRRMYHIKRLHPGANTLVVNPAGNDLIDRQTSIVNISSRNGVQLNATGHPSLSESQTDISFTAPNQFQSAAASDFSSLSPGDVITVSSTSGLNDSPTGTTTDGYTVLTATTTTVTIVEGGITTETAVAAGTVVVNSIGNWSII